MSKDNTHLKLIQLVSNYCLPSELHKTSILPILSKDLLRPSKFERNDIFKIVKTNTNKNKSGIRVSAAILLKIKNK